MRQQSAAYAPFPAVRSVDFRVTFELIDTEANGNATVTSSGYESFTAPENLLNDVSEAAGKWATLENNLWALDGTFENLPASDAGDNGWWSEAVSGADAKFSEDSLPEIYFTFSAPVSTIGFSLFFDEKAEQFPTKIRFVATGADGKTISDKTVETSGASQIINMPIKDYTALQISFLETFLPFRRVKMQEIIFGIIQRFDKDNLASAKLKYGADLAAETFPSRELTFTFDNSDKKYNLLNPTGIYEYLQDRQEITAAVRIGGEDVDMGKFYFTAAAAKDSAVTAQITANDIVLELDGETFDTGSNTTKTLSLAVADVLAGKNVQTSFEGDLGAAVVGMTIPTGTTKREAIRLLAQAAMCSVWVDRDGVMRFANLSVAETAASELTADELYSYDGVSVSAKVDAVVVKSQNPFVDGAEEQVYIAGTSGAAKTISNPCVTAAAGQAVAEWLLSCYKRRKSYSVKNRCDPAVEVADTIKIADAYGQSGNAAVTEISISYDGGVYANTSAIGG